jgi:hypothetical protein
LIAGVLSFSEVSRIDGSRALYSAPEGKPYEYEELVENVRPEVEADARVEMVDVEEEVERRGRIAEGGVGSRGEWGSVWSRDRAVRGGEVRSSDFWGRRGASSEEEEDEVMLRRESRLPACGYLSG